MEMIGIIICSVMNILDDFKVLSNGGKLENNGYLCHFHSLEEIHRRVFSPKHNSSFMEAIEIYANSCYATKNPQDSGDVLEPGYIFFVFTMNNLVYISAESNLIRRLFDGDFEEWRKSIEDIGFFDSLPKPENVIIRNFPIFHYQNKSFAMISDNLKFFLDDNCRITIDIV